MLAALGERLRLVRLRRSLTTTTVAMRCDISRPTLAKMERGDPSVSFGNYLRLLSIYGLEGDANQLAADDVLGRRLQDLELPMSRRGRK
jgi:transcriptional regulator with XRE-family HTH domain